MGWIQPLCAQEGELPTTRDFTGRLQRAIERNEESLKELRTRSDTTIGRSLEMLDSLMMERRRGRGTEVEEPPNLIRVNFIFQLDHTYRLLDPNETPGFLLTGKWISDYAKKVKLVPALERSLAAYRKQAELHNQLIGELEGAIAIKDEKNAVLQEMNRALRERGDLYKAKAEVLQDPWFKKFFRSLAYPLGFTAGVFVGVIIANNS